MTDKQPYFEDDRISIAADGEVTAVAKRRDGGNVSPETLEAVLAILEAVEVDGDDLLDVLLEAAAERKYVQTALYGMVREGGEEALDKLGQERILQWISLGRVVESVRNYFNRRRGRGIKLTAEKEAERNEIARFLIGRIYELADEEYEAAARGRRWEDRDDE